METKKIPPQRQDVPPLDPDSRTGLTEEQVRQRLDAGWSNRVDQRSSRTEKDIIRGNCLTFFNMVFLVMAVLMLLVGSSPLNLTFLGVVFVNTAIGCFQEIRAKRAVDKLTLVAAQTVKTVRNGSVTSVRSDLLVRDDIVEFAAGDQICADAIVRAGNLQVNESLITGEADAIMKTPGDTLRSGSFVVAGRARAQLTQVGDDAFAAKLAAEAKKDPKSAKSEMMASLDKLIRVIGFALIPVGILLFLHQYRSNAGIRDSMEATVAALVGMIPEGLYLLTSVALAVSSLKLTRRRVLVQDMNCIESLARVDVLCVDKTGTITEPTMDLEQVIPLTKDPPEYLEAVLTALYGSIEPENDTGRALYNMFCGNTDWKCLRHIPFDSRIKWSASVYETYGAFIAGAPEFVMGDAYDTVRSQVEAWSCTGYRVLLVAKYDGDPDPAGLDSRRMTPLALLALTNRLRPQAVETFRYFAKQGVTVKVISGDSAATVSDVARRAGIENAENYIDTGDLTTREDFLRAAQEYTVFGRVTPDKKKLLVRALKELGHTVAMTGDGVNDVLAMKESDCGIAMASGSQAASQVARLVLLDSDFSSMPDIVGEGRRVINNIQRAATLFLVKNIFSLGLALVTLFTNLRFPLESFHLSIVSVLTIGLPGFFLALEPNYQRTEGRFLATAIRRALPSGLTNILVVLTSQAIMAGFQMPVGDGQSITTAILCCVGLLVLLTVCKPFTTLRKILCVGICVCVVGAFFVLPPALGYLGIADRRSWLIMLVMLIMAPTVFVVLHRIFDWCEALLGKIKRKLKKKT